MFEFFRGKDFRNDIVSKAAKINSESSRKIVLADSTDLILEAASLIKKRRIAHPVILGDSKVLLERFSKLGFSNLGDDNVIDYLGEHNKEQLDKFVQEYLEIKKAEGKVISEADAEANMSRPHYYGAMLVKKGLASGMISGAGSETKPYYPAFEIVKLAPGVSRTSGVFLMADKRNGGVFFFADCVMNMSPSAEQLAEIAELTARTCSGFEITPKVAMLSFSTRDSAKHESVERVKLATAMVKRKLPDLIVDGEIQLDAAIVPEVMRRKCPDSVLKGEANVLIFPDLNAGNIGYKLVERLAGYEAIGPFLQGLSLPLNDLSRGCSAEDVMYVAAVTVIQSKSAERHAQEAHVKKEASAGEQPGSHEHKKQTHEHKAVKKAHSHDGKYDPLDRLPSNVRKIIEEGRNKHPKKEVPD